MLSCVQYIMFLWFSGGFEIRPGNVRKDEEFSPAGTHQESVQVSNKCYKLLHIAIYSYILLYIPTYRYILLHIPTYSYIFLHIVTYCYLFIIYLVLIFISPHYRGGIPYNIKAKASKYSIWFVICVWHERHWTSSKFSKNYENWESGSLYTK